MNGSAANWAPEVEFSPFRALSRRQMTGASPVTIPETLSGRGSTPVLFSFLNRRMGRDARQKTGIKVFFNYEETNASLIKPLKVSVLKQTAQ